MKTMQKKIFWMTLEPSDNRTSTVDTIIQKFESRLRRESGDTKKL